MWWESQALNLSDDEEGDDDDGGHSHLQFAAQVLVLL